MVQVCGLTAGGLEIPCNPSDLLTHLQGSALGKNPLAFKFIRELGG